jgi:hypothetical protein
MGKKKSSVSKQKQVQKAKQNQQRQGKKMGGVAVSKGMNSKFQHGKTPAIVVVDSKKPQDTNSKTLSTTKPQKQQLFKTKRKVFLSPQPTVPGKKNNMYDEQKEFQRQMASMQERQMAAESCKKKKKDFSKKGPPVEFQPASFSLEISTQDLLQETVNQMESMTGVGGTSTNFTSTPIRTNQSWAVAKDPSDVMNNKNPFAALGGEDSEEEEANEWDHKIPSFNMAPASFSLLPRTTPTPAPTPCRYGDDDEYDPYL